MLADVVKLGIALGELAKTMEKEPSFKVLGVTLENTRLSRDDIEYLGQIVSREVPFKVGYAFYQGVPTVWLISEEALHECTKF